MERAGKAPTGDSLVPPDDMAGNVGGSMTEFKQPRRNIGVSAGQNIMDGGLGGKGGGLNGGGLGGGSSFKQLQNGGGRTFNTIESQPNL